jgi:hypothetical protein
VLLLVGIRSELSDHFCWSCPDVKGSGDVTAITAARVFALLAAVVAAFHIALAGGMPWGHLTWGGRFPGRLPNAMRVVAAASAVLIFVFALVVTIRAGIIFPEWRPMSRRVVWGVVAYSALGVLANALTPSRPERIVWLPIALAMLACSIAVALN